MSPKRINMKRLILISLITSSVLLAQENTFSTYLTDAVNSVEDARKDAVKALNKMVDFVDTAKEKNATIAENSISTQIVEAHAIGTIAQSTADVEIAKAKAIATITQAVDTIEKADPQTLTTIKEEAYQQIINAVASVEIAKAKASKNIVEATQRVELSKLQPQKNTLSR
jgi:hypothetical protein